MGLESCSSSCSSGVTALTTIPIPNCLGVGQALGRATPSIESVVLESARLSILKGVVVAGDQVFGRSNLGGTIRMGEV